MEKGVTSSQFIERMEKTDKQPFGDEQVTGLTAQQFKDIVTKEDTISQTVRDFKEAGLTEFSAGWSTRMLMQAQMEMSKLASEIQSMVSGIAGGQTEAEKINKDMERRSRRNLGYIG
jgi:hypothetical protein